MRRAGVTILAAAGLACFAATPALASSGSGRGGGDHAKKCDTSGHRGENSGPGNCKDRGDRDKKCENRGHGNCKDRDRCDKRGHGNKCKPKPEPKPCEENPHAPGCEQPPVPKPEGACAHADLVLLSKDAKIICLYGPNKGQLATKDRECPGALIATGPDPLLHAGLCVFLPPQGDEPASTPGAGGTPMLPGMPPMSTGMLSQVTGMLSQVTGMATP